MPTLVLPSRDGAIPPMTSLTYFVCVTNTLNYSVTNCPCVPMCWALPVLLAFLCKRSHLFINLLIAGRTQGRWHFVFCHFGWINRLLDGICDKGPVTFNRPFFRTSIGNLQLGIIAGMSWNVAIQVTSIPINRATVEVTAQNSMRVSTSNVAKFTENIIQQV